MQNCALIVEDDPDIGRLLQTILGRRCRSVELAPDGERAIDLLRSRTYDLVVLDLMLPKANGLAVAEAIQALPKPPKVIVLSALSRYFADRFPPGTLVLQKPFEVEQIEALLTTLEEG
jgi:DNA-binding response OmpR family regulator